MPLPRRKLLTEWKTHKMQALLAASQFIAQACIAGLWQGLALIAAVAILLRLMPRVSAAVRFAVWAFAFGLAATMPLLQLTTVSALRPHAPSAIVHLGAGWGFVIGFIWAASGDMHNSFLWKAPSMRFCKEAAGAPSRSAPPPMWIRRA